MLVGAGLREVWVEGQAFQDLSQRQHRLAEQKEAIEMARKVNPLLCSAISSPFLLAEKAAVSLRPNPGTNSLPCLLGWPFSLSAAGHAPSSAQDRCHTACDLFARAQLHDIGRAALS